MSSIENVRKLKETKVLKSQRCIIPIKRSGKGTLSADGMLGDCLAMLQGQLKSIFKRMKVLLRIFQWSLADIKNVLKELFAEAILAIQESAQ